MDAVNYTDLMLLAAAAGPFSDPAWVFELKYDGFRVLTLKDGERVRLLSRHGNDMAQSFPELVGAVAQLPVDHLALDGELVVLDGAGTPQFERLNRRAYMRDRHTIADAATKEPAAIFAFDVLSLDGHDCRDVRLLDRKAMLGKVLRRSHVVRCVQHVDEHGEAFFAKIDRLQLEGMVAKRASSLYRAGCTGHWLKIKTRVADAREALKY